MSLLQEFGKVPGRQARQRIAVIVALAAILVIGWFAYAPAFSGPFLLDDFDNLGKLGQVRDAESRWYFVLSGVGGPSGRPLALATFLPQAEYWGSDPAPFLQFNVGIHLLNGLLLFLFARLLARELDVKGADAALLALATTAIWLLMPLLASSSLMIVQRMTTLSASFVLLGLVVYLCARRRLSDRPNAALAAMTVTLVIATSLAILSKENGVLLPLLVLALEATVLNPPAGMGSVKWRCWYGVFLLVPLAGLLLVLASYLSWDDRDLLRRGFSSYERVLTQARVLWHYLLNALLPRPAVFSPFHDAYPVARTLLQPLTLAAVAGWAFVLGAALRYRRQAPVAALAVLWYLGGHLLESTTVPLELYFEHRNYVPMIGPVFALAYGAIRVDGDYRGYARAALACFALLGSAVLLAVTTSWGKPLQAASIWHLQQPQSVRAATTLATRQMEEKGPMVAFATLEAFAALHPEHGYIRVPALTIACSVAPDQDHSELAEAIEKQLPRVRFTYTTISMLDQLLSRVGNGSCNGVGRDRVVRLANALIRNPAYNENDTIQQLHQKLLARVARMGGDADAALSYLRQAASYAHDDDLAMMMVTTLVENHRFGEARAYLESVDSTMPVNPIQRAASRIYLDSLAGYIAESESLSEAAEGARQNQASETN